MSEVMVRPPCRHFVYFGEIEHIDEPLSLTARRAGAEETVVFESNGHR